MSRSNSQIDPLVGNASKKAKTGHAVLAPVSTLMGHSLLQEFITQDYQASVQTVLGQALQGAPVPTLENSQVPTLENSQANTGNAVPAPALSSTLEDLINNEDVWQNTVVSASMNSLPGAKSLVQEFLSDDSNTAVQAILDKALQRSEEQTTAGPAAAPSVDANADADTKADNPSEETTADVSADAATTTADIETKPEEQPAAESTAESDPIKEAAAPMEEAPKEEAPKEEPAKEEQLKEEQPKEDSPHKSNPAQSTTTPMLINIFDTMEDDASHHTLDDASQHTLDTLDDSAQRPPIALLCIPPPQQLNSELSFEAVLQLWNGVAENLSKQNSKIDWAEVAEALKYAHRYLPISANARAFVDKYLAKIMITLPTQLLEEIDQSDEQDCVKTSFRCSLRIVNDDLKAFKNKNHGDNLGICSTLDALGHIFSKNKVYYNGMPEGHRENMFGCDMFDDFQHICGFENLVAYLNAKVTTPQFPNLEFIKYLLQATFESFRSSFPGDTMRYLAQEEMRKIAQVVMKHILWLDDAALEKMDLCNTISVLRQFFYAIYGGRPQSSFSPQSNPKGLSDFFDFWRSLAFKLVTSQSLPVKLFGWNQITALIAKSEKMCPPPMAYVVSGAGTDFINGKYDVDPETMMESVYFDPDRELQYRRQIPADDADSEGAGKTITLFQCTVSSQHTSWFLSEAGTDSDIDYYQHNSLMNVNGLPSISGWIACGRGAGPAPTLKPVGLLVPAGEEHNTLEHQLAKWAIENRLVELALGGSTHSEIVEKSLELFRFLARMCHRFDWLSDGGSSRMDIDVIPNQFFLKASHLLFAWESCRKTADFMVLTQIYLLLLSICPSLSSHLDELASPIIQTAMMRRIELNDPTLLELQIGSNFTADPIKGEVGVYEPINSADFARLGYNIGKNTHLEGVHFYGTLVLEEMNIVLASEFFLGLKQNSSIRALSLDHCSISENPGIEILNTFANRNSNLTELSLWNCDIRNGGIHLVATLRNCTHLKKINLRGYIGSECLTELIAAIRGHTKLATLSLNGNRIGSAGCNILADLLKDPQCNLVALDLNHNQVNADGAIVLANALAKNIKLENLVLLGNGVTRRGVFDAFFQVLCNTSSINATYLSNHTLIGIGAEVGSAGIGIDSVAEASNFRSYLRMNTGADKNQVAIKKILRHHSHIDMESFFEWDLKVLPAAIVWFDRARACTENDEAEMNVDLMKLSAIYQFTRAMPMVFVPASRR